MKRIHYLTAFILAFALGLGGLIAFGRSAEIPVRITSENDPGRLTAVTDKETVDFDTQRQVFFALVSVIENHRRMIERGEVEPSQIHIQVGPLIDFLHASLQDSRTGPGRHQNNRYSS